MRLTDEDEDEDGEEEEEEDDEFEDRSTYSLNIPPSDYNKPSVNGNLHYINEGGSVASSGGGGVGFVNSNANNKQKSASTEHLNEFHHSYPPPKIQPFSGVLSKSLLSVVLKPRPLKPIVEDNFPTTTTTTNNNNSNSMNSHSNVDLTKHSFLNASASSSATLPNQRTMITNSYLNEAQSRLLKAKCASTTNLNEITTTAKGGGGGGFDHPSSSSNQYQYGHYIYHI